MRNAKCVVRNEGSGASKLYSAANYIKKEPGIHRVICFRVLFYIIMAWLYELCQAYHHYALRTTHYAFIHHFSVPPLTPIHPAA